MSGGRRPALPGALDSARQRRALTRHSHPPTPQRFYFVSDPTLLEILSLGSDPPSVVPHFQSGLFDSLSNVTFDKAWGVGLGVVGSCVVLGVCLLPHLMPALRWGVSPAADGL